jgi:hypothetical protein
VLPGAITVVPVPATVLEVMSDNKMTAMDGHTDIPGLPWIDVIAVSHKQLDVKLMSRGGWGARLYAILHG